MNRPIVVDLFAGAGGLSLGFEQAGFDVAACVEIDPVHAATHAYNFPNCAVLCADISKLSGAEIRGRSTIKSQKVSVVVGGAPCQGFSLIGQRALDDPRNSLVNDFVRLVCELDSDYFVFENVKGLTLGKHRIFLDELVRAFGSNGYNVLTPWKVLNATRYGVPQDRQRLFLLGAKLHLNLPEYPLAKTRGPNDEAIGLPGTSSGPNCKDALGDLPSIEALKQLIATDEVALPKTAWGQTSTFSREMRCLSRDCWHYGYEREWDRNVLTSSMKAEHTDISRRRFAATVQGTVEPISRFFKLSAKGVSNTLRAGTDAARGAFTSPRPIHYKYARCVTVREMARLHGFPDWFRLHETKWHGARQIGNSVPPPLARSVAESLVRAMRYKPRRPKKIMSLGDKSLLQMSVREAAEYWGIIAPIASRNKKSGVKKRKQQDIPSAKMKTPNRVTRKKSRSRAYRRLRTAA